MIWEVPGRQRQTCSNFSFNARPCSLSSTFKRLWVETNIAIRGFDVPKAFHKTSCVKQRELLEGLHPASLPTKPSCRRPVGHPFRFGEVLWHHGFHAAQSGWTKGLKSKKKGFEGGSRSWGDFNIIFGGVVWGRIEKNLLSPSKTAYEAKTECASSKTVWTLTHSASQGHEGFVKILAIWLESGCSWSSDLS